MRVRWFGDPWPSDVERAPICDDDLYRIPTPTGRRCVGCPELIEKGERGIATAFGGPDTDGDLAFLVRDRGGYVLACAYHIDCWIEGTAGPEFAGLIARRG